MFNRNNNDNNRQMSLSMLLILLLGLYFLGSIVASFIQLNRTNATIDISEIKYLADELFERVSDEEKDLGKFKANIVSSSQINFVIQKYKYNDSNIKYIIPVKTTTDTLKIYKLSESSFNLYILGEENIEPYAIFEFSLKDYDYPKKVNLYIPSNHTFEMIDESKTLKENYLFD